MILDPYLISAIRLVTKEQLYEAFMALYPHDIGDAKEDLVRQLGAWLEKARQKPGLSFSTGGTKSFRGMATCALLAVLGHPTPKSKTPRMKLAWAILDSPEGARALGHIPELEPERPR